MGKNIFILSAPRSISTTAGICLGQHSDLFFCPEINIWEYDNLKSMMKHDKAEQKRSGLKYTVLAGLIRVLGELEQFEISDEQEVDAWIENHGTWSCRRMQHEIVDLVSPLKPVFKSTRLPMSVTALAKVTEYLDETYFVHLIRHPSNVVNSLSKLSPQPQGIRKINLHAQTWIYANKNIQKAMSLLPRERSVQIRAEDLLRNPDEVFSCILTNAGFPASARELRNVLKPELSKYAQPCPIDPQLYMDSGFLSRPKLARSEQRSLSSLPLPTNVSNWQMHSLATLANAYGYSL